MMMLLAAFAFAQAPKLISISYKSIDTCYPKLADPRFMKSVDLNLLLQKASEVYASQSNEIRSRTVKFKDAVATRRLTLSAKTEKYKTVWAAEWETVAESGDSQKWVNEGLKPVYANMLEINTFLARMNVLSDLKTEIDTKLNGPTVTVHKDKEKILDIKFVENGKKKLLSCTRQEDDSAICACY